MRVAAIDCGTNSIRLLIADADEQGPPDAPPALTEVLRRAEVGQTFNCNRIRLVREVVPGDQTLDRCAIYVEEVGDQGRR